MTDFIKIVHEVTLSNGETVDCTSIINVNHIFCINFNETMKTAMVWMDDNQETCYYVKDFKNILNFCIQYHNFIKIVHETTLSNGKTEDCTSIINVSHILCINFNETTKTVMIWMDDNQETCYHIKGFDSLLQFCIPLHIPFTE